eukprot:987426-Pelagomonas_calceolata.AAC.1
MDDGSMVAPFLSWQALILTQALGVPASSESSTSTQKTQAALRSSCLSCLASWWHGARSSRATPSCHRCAAPHWSQICLNQLQAAARSRSPKIQGTAAHLALKRVSRCFVTESFLSSMDPVITKKSSLLPHTGHVKCCA